MYKILSFFLIVAFIYIAVVVVMYLFQRKLMYHPQRADLDPQHFHMERTQRVRLKSADGVEVTVWEALPAENMPVIVYFHGNAAHIGVEYRAQRFRAFIEKGFGLLVLSYRGYGDSDGSPSEEGLMEDARAVLRYAKEERGLSSQQILLFGESLGSGVAVRMATEFAVKGMILDSPYTSTANRAAEIYPWLPVHVIMKDTFDSLAWIEHVGCPVLILHGDADVVIPVHHGRQLFAAARQPKYGFFPVGVGHVEVSSEDILRLIYSFILSFSPR